MNLKDITLGKIAAAGFLFNSLTRYNTSLAKFRKATGRRLDLGSEGDRNSLLIWLNAWGCRHPSKENHRVASRSILDWYQTDCATSFDVDMPLWRLDDRDLTAAAAAYGSLKGRLGARRVRYANKSEVSIGRTAASKILFALRPKALMPWDRDMRKSLGYSDGSPESYFEYMVEIRDIVLHIKDLCETKGFQIDDLPAKIDRPDSTVVELLNEYIWVITRKPLVKLPSSQTLARWSSLG
jgi:hypothetical protein